MSGEDVSGKKFRILLTSCYGDAVAVNTWNTYTWKSALAKAGIILPQAEGRSNGNGLLRPRMVFRVLRYIYA
ncbi:hypothetical protein ABZ840_23080 [Streptomyces sp. NPDC047117]|uniref:hypothetical protein n=1 Tax=Streptomyces sp. NPDC047117 TaxID=3155379 RepID=UPI0033D48426